VLDVAGQAINADAEHYVDPLALYMRQKLLDAEAGAEARTADGRIRIGRDQVLALFGGKGLAEFDLRFDRILILAVGGVAGIKQDVLGHGLNSI
jgi:hypothetical protein